MTDTNLGGDVRLTALGDRSGGAALGGMYVLSVIFLFLASIVVVVLMLVPPGEGEATAAEDAYTPGTMPGFVPLQQPAGLTDPPGVSLLERGRYKVVIEAYNWEFNPKEIRVPVGAEVEFYVRSSQDYHGFALVGTDLVLQLLTNEVAKGPYIFSEPGEHLFVCADYCGAGHGAMVGTVIVE